MKDHLVLSVQDAQGVKHDIRADDFAASALNDIIGRISMLEAFLAELVNRDAVVGKDLREKLSSFVKARA